MRQRRALRVLHRQLSHLFQPTAAAFELRGAIFAIAACGNMDFKVTFSATVHIAGSGTVH